jgi:hypothetical protein
VEWPEKNSFSFLNTRTLYVNDFFEECKNDGNFLQFLKVLSKNLL